VEVEQVVEQVVEDVKELETTMEEEVYVEQLSFLDDEPSDENEEELDEAEEIAQMIQRENDHGTNLSKIAQIAGVSNGTVSKALNKGKVAPKSLNKIRDALAALQEDALDEIYEKVNGVLENPPMQKPRLGERILQKVAEPVKEKPKYTLDEMKNLRPLIWDDETVRDYLRQFDFIELKPFRTKEEFIDAVIAYRTEQREKNVPTNAMVMIQPKLVYVGEPLPLEIGIKNMWQDIHIIYKGPAGTGKTVIAQTLSALLNMPLYTMNGSTDTDSDMIIGSQGASNGSTYVMEGLLVNAMKNAGIFYADEANFVLPEILSVVNAALDHRKEIYNYNNHEHVVGHRNFRFLASINEGYEGTKTMNKATTDRTVSVVVNYMSPKHLKDYLRDYMKKEDLSDFQRNVLKMDQVSEADIILLANIATALQNGVKNQNIGLPQEVASTRNIVQLLRETRTLPFEVAIKTIVQKYDVDVRSAIVSVLENVGRLNLNARDIISA
jgi:MoxR-like ATPase